MEMEATLVELGRLELSVPPAEYFRMAFTPELSALPITLAMADRVAELKGSCFHKVPSGAGTEQRKPVSAWAFIGQQLGRRGREHGVPENRFQPGREIGPDRRRRSRFRTALDRNRFDALPDLDCLASRHPPKNGRGLELQVPDADRLHG